MPQKVILYESFLREFRNDDGMNVVSDVMFTYF